MTNMNKVYKIRNKRTGLYSTGGAPPGWSTNGKVWRREGDLKSHLTIASDYYVKKRKRYERGTLVDADENFVIDDFEVVTFVEIASETIPLREVIERPSKS